MPAALAIDAFLARSGAVPVLDVRAPSEFRRGHIPGAVSFPLFSDAERADVGTLYKQSGSRAAMLRGMELVGPKLAALSAGLLDAADRAGGELLVHCWRGGMRSASVAWLAGTLGCRVHTLAGGYKAFRRWVLSPDGMDRRVEVVSGLTGSGKTEILAALAALGESVIDLEALARHKGSAFGDLGAPPQPTQEQFENDLVTAWRVTDPARPVWLEDESRTIGRCFLPEAIWRQLSGARHHLVDLPDAARVAHLVRGYAGYPLDLLESRVQTISRRLGGDRAAAALAALRAGDPSAACTMILAYYDRAYRKCLDAVPAARITTQRFETLDPRAIAATLKTAATSPPP